MGVLGENAVMNTRWLWLKRALVVLTLLFIWGNSMLPGALSGQESRFVYSIIQPIAAPIERLLTEHGFSVDPDHLVRKTAHFTEYLMLGIWLSVLLRRDGRASFLLTAGLCLGAALLDEGIQMFAMDRGPSFADVALDFCGALVGIGIAALLAALIRALRRKRPKHAGRERSGKR